MKRFFPFLMTTVAALFISTALVGCEVELGSDGPIEEAAEEVED